MVEALIKNLEREEDTFKKVCKMFRVWWAHESNSIQESHPLKQGLKLNELWKGKPIYTFNTM